MYKLTRRSFTFGTALVLASLMFASSAAASITAAARTGASDNCVPSAAGLALTDGAQAYCDRLDPQYSWTGFPGDLTDVLSRTEYLIVANEDRDVADYGLEVTVDFEGTLLLFIDQRVDVDANMPWVASDGYSDSGLTVTLNTEPAFPNQLFDIWTLDVEPGDILLGPTATGPQNQAGTGNYGVAYVTDEVDIEIVAENLGSEPVTAGVTDDWWVKFTVTNLGPDDASGVVFDGVFVNSNPLTGFVCSVETEDGTLTDTGPGTTTWDIGDLAFNETAVLERKCTIGAGVPAGTTVAWDFTLNSVDQQDPNTANDTDGIDSTIQRVATWDVTKIWDGGEVDVNLTCSDGTDVSTTTSGLTAQFTHTGFADGVDCVVTETVPDGFAPTYTADCDVTDILSGSVYSCDITNATTTVRFKVTKVFSDKSSDPVEVTLTCDTGLPLTQSLTIAGGDPIGVTFVVTDYIDGTMNCAVTEVTNTPGYDMDTSGCVWDNVMTADSPFSCVVDNTAQDATYTAWMEWNVSGESGEAVDEEVLVTITCNSLITGSNGSTGSCGIGCWNASKVLGDDESLVAKVSTLTGTATCSATQGILPSGVESTSNEACTDENLDAGENAICVFTNTVFFEGIPTLSQYGLALLALLMLGVGMVGFRRFA